MAHRQFFSFKNSAELPEIQYIHPYLLLVLAELVCYALDRGYPAPIITSMARTAAENAQAGAESTSHMTMRAFDISSRNLTEDHIQDICSHLNRTFDHLAAVSYSGKKVLAIYHAVEGGQFHIHIQIHRRFELETWKGLPL